MARGAKGEPSQGCSPPWATTPLSHPKTTDSTRRCMWEWNHPTTPTRTGESERPAVSYLKGTRNEGSEVSRYQRSARDLARPLGSAGALGQSLAWELRVDSTQLKAPLLLNLTQTSRLPPASHTALGDSCSPLLSALPASEMHALEGPLSKEHLAKRKRSCKGSI